MFTSFRRKYLGNPGILYMYKLCIINSYFRHRALFDKGLGSGSKSNLGSRQENEKEYLIYRDIATQIYSVNIFDQQSRKQISLLYEINSHGTLSL